VVTNRSRAQIRVTRERARPSILMLGILVTLAYAGVNWIETVEVATLRARPLGMEPHVARVFVVDDPPFIWVRAERPDRLWLKAIQANPEVRLTRGGRETAYYAIVSNREGTQENVAALFHEKYGFLDTLSGWISARDAVPIRLEPDFY
jgi:hypothetical protein